MDKLDVNQQLDKAKQAMGSLSGDLLKYAIFAIVVLVILYAVTRFLKKKKPVTGSAENLQIDVLALGTQGPPADGPVLEFCNVPVRLALVVLAPAGRVRELPPLNRMEDAYEALLPGLAQVVAAHRPMIRRWPPQVSSNGFAHLFFQHARLPGQGGKGTPWSSAAGVFKIDGQPMMAGMVFRCERPSNRGQQIMDSEEKWLGILRVKGTP
ncbi:MAG: hypothetical protein ACLQNE_43590 [Thermoguttaceae bacterium]